MHAPRKSTEWKRHTLTKAQAICVVEAEPDAPDGSFRDVRFILTGGVCSYRIIEDGYDANEEIADGRTYMWSTLVGPTDRVSIPLLPSQTIWAMVSNQAGTAGLSEFSVIIAYLQGHS